MCGFLKTKATCQAWNLYGVTENGRGWTGGPWEGWAL